MPAWLARFAVGEVGGLDDDADPRRVEREGEARARLGAALAELARGVPRGSTTPGAYGASVGSMQTTAADALAETFEDLRPLLFSIAYRMLGSVSEAEDIVQEAFLRYQRALVDRARRSSRRRRTCRR